MDSYLYALLLVLALVLLAYLLQSVPCSEYFDSLLEAERDKARAGVAAGDRDRL